MKKSLTVFAVLALVAVASVSWASTSLNSLKGDVYRLALKNNLGTAVQPMAAQTITICKKTIPSGGTGFPFTWANGSGPLAPFTLNDGGCTTKNMTGQDHYNKFTENVPSGWTLTNISCAARTSPVKIIGADPNPAFQPGDNTVTIDLNEPNVTCTFVNQRQTPVDPCCPPWNKDMLKDMLFYRGTSISAPYTLEFVPTTLFKNQMQAYINYLHFNPAITGITIDWRLHNQGTASTPIPPYGPQVGSTAYATWTWNTSGVGNPTLIPNPFFTLPTYSMIVGTWYLVHTGIYLENGQHFFPDTCANNEIYVRIQVMNAKSPVANSGPVLEFSDGKKVIKSVPINEGRQQQR